MIGTRLRMAATRLMLPVTWRWNSDRAAGALKQFSEVEFDSAWQYLNAMSYTDNPDVQMALFENVLEEMEHSDAFRRLAYGLATVRLRRSYASRMPLVSEASHIPGFLAFAHESERAICTQFKGFSRACRFEPRVMAVFQSIVVDEEGHEAGARSLLETLLEDRKHARRMIFRARVSRAYQSWLRGSQRIGDAMFRLFLSTVFFACGFFFVGTCRRRLRYRVDGQVQ
jgi:rubrerythrin